MADGGWTHYHIIEYPHDGSYVGEQTAMAQLQAGLEAMSGWSRHTDISLYTTRCLWFSIEHTSGARLVVAYGGDNPSSLLDLIAAGNDPYDDRRGLGYYNGTVWLCYIPASFSATALGTHPGTTPFLPTNSFRFFPASGYQDFSPTSNIRNENHILSRGDNLIWVRSNDSDADSRVNRLLMMGDCIDPLRHAADTGVLAKTAFMTWDDVYYTSTFRCQFYTSDTWRSDGAWYLPTTLLGQDVCAVEPWTWGSPTIYISTTDLDNEGVVTGNSIKGLISPEWFRLVAIASGPLNDKEQLNGGDFVYLRGGFAVGYDASNGRMA